MTLDDDALRGANNFKWLSHTLAEFCSWYIWYYQNCFYATPIDDWLEAARFSGGFKDFKRWK